MAANGEWDGLRVLISGGSSGIGRAAAHLFAARGARVVIGGIDANETAATAAELAGSGEVSGRPVDVTDDEAVHGFVQDAVAQLGGLDTVVTAAGIQTYGTADSTSPADWNRVLDVNLTGTFLVVHHALPHLRAAAPASVVIVSSVQAFAPQTTVAGYSTSKAALNGFARSVALDEAAHGVRVNAVCPGSVDTPMLRYAAEQFGGAADAADTLEAWGRMHPIGRIAQPAEVAEVIGFLAGPRSSFVTGTSIPVDGGLTCSLGVALD